MEKHYLEFERADENKFIYTDIHNEYVSFFVMTLLICLSTIH